MTDILGYKDSNDVADITAVYDPIVAQLGTRYSAISDAWNAANAAQAGAWSQDYFAMRSRYATAKAIPWSPATNEQNEYDAIIRAIRQGGEGAPIQTGDVDDLKARISAAERSLGAPTPQGPATPQPTAYDAGWSVFKESTGIDPVASLLGAQKSGNAAVDAIGEYVSKHGGAKQPSLIPWWGWAAGGLLAASFVSQSLGVPSLLSILASKEKRR